eukprot:g7690.t1
MRVNLDSVVLGARVALVPYLKEHVEPYHAWMADPWLQEMTASEPLSLEAEYEMQRAWAEDGDKLTFIVLELARVEGAGQGGAGDEAAIASAVARARVSAMVGDVNLFFNDPDGDKGVCELEIMIADPAARRGGLGSEAALLMMRYAMERLAPPVWRFFCKIGDANEASISMFKRLGFVVCGHVAAFQETELEAVVGAKPVEAGRVAGAGDKEGQGEQVEQPPGGAAPLMAQFSVQAALEARGAGYRTVQPVVFAPLEVGA